MFVLYECRTCFNYVLNVKQLRAIPVVELKAWCSLQTRRTASWLSEKMKGDGHSVALLSGELSVEERAEVIKSFRNGKEKVLITTNVSARGMLIGCLRSYLTLFCDVSRCCDSTLDKVVVLHCNLLC